MEDKILKLPPLYLHTFGSREHVCPYCGKPMKAHMEYDEYDVITTYSCQCEESKKAAEIVDEIMKLYWALPPQQYKIGESIVKIK